jgi:hypothetical protein
MTIPEYLLGKDRCEFKVDLCYGDCSSAVKQNPATGKWFITMGHPGFNCGTNNRAGFASAKVALGVLKHFAKR